MGELTDLQVECERRLNQLLAELGMFLTDRTVRGESESYLAARIDGTALTVFVYEDGEAQLHGGERDHRLELADYPEGGVEALWEDLERRVRAEIAGAKHKRLGGST